MNARRRLQREIIRHRRNRPWRTTLTRFTLSSGLPVRVVVTLPRYPWQKNRATYRVARASVYGLWPPTPELLRELGRWA